MELTEQREQSQACLNSAEREQARPKVKAQPKIVREDRLNEILRSKQ